MLISISASRDNLVWLSSHWGSAGPVGLEVLARPYLALPVESQAGSPVHSPAVRSCHLDNIQIERLLEKNYVVLCEPEAVVVAWGEEGVGVNGADHLRVLQGTLPLHPVL